MIVRRQVRPMIWPSLLFILFLPSMAFSWQEPGGFRGIPWGGSEGAVQEKFASARCADAGDDTFGDRVCRVAIGIGKIKVPEAALWFRSGGLVGVSMFFAARDFKVMSEVFVERYGPPSSREFGKLMWLGSTATVLLFEGTSRPGIAFASITLTEELRRRKDQEDKDRHGASKDL